MVVTAGVWVGEDNTQLFFFLKDEIKLLANFQNIALFVCSKAFSFFVFLFFNKKMSSCVIEKLSNYQSEQGKYFHPFSNRHYVCMSCSSLR